MLGANPNDINTREKTNTITDINQLIEKETIIEDRKRIPWRYHQNVINTKKANLSVKLCPYS
jgi:hypothetical protein